MGSIETELHKLHAIGAEKKKQEQASQPAKEPTKIQTTTSMYIITIFYLTIFGIFFI